MSQLRNLLTNKVIAHKLGGASMTRYRRARKSLRSQSERIRSEITEQRALAASQFVPKSQPKPGFLRRVGNFLNRAFKGA